MSRADAAQEIAAYLAGPVPEGAAADLRDLGVIGFANEIPGVTPETMRTLTAGARQHGRSWQAIGRRLDMTAVEAEAAYQELSGEHQQSTGWRHVIAGFLNRLAERADALSNSLNRASQGLERSHHL
jgi:hypothetical protein